MDIVDRLKLFMANLNYSSSQFADTANIPRPTLSQIITGRNKKISNEIFAKLHDSFPELNMMWLMFGDGDMLVNGANGTSSRNISGYRNSGQYGDLFSDMANTDNAGNASNCQDRSPTPHKSLLTESTKIKDNSSIVDNDQSFNVSSLNDIVHGKQNTKNFNEISHKSAEIHKNIVSIMVFYDDNSFETFYPNAPVGQ